MNHRFRWHERLHREADFTRVIRQGRRVSASGLILWTHRLPEGETPPRLGLAIPKRYGRAVDRNRLKRLLREVFRLNKDKLLPGVDMVFSALPMSGKPRYQTIEPLVLALWSKSKLLSNP
ncbi:MAG: ribonuclease P protein component [Elusimicrobiota bacterium]|jgi:ribonuclease P protein component